MSEGILHTPLARQAMRCFGSYRNKPRSYVKNLIHQLLSLCLLLMVTACGPTGIEADWHDYRQRMQRIFDTPIAVPPVERDTLLYPARRVLTVHPPRQTIGLLEFLQLSHCDLHRLVAEHNSLLNRQQGLSEQLFYDLEFIDSALICLESARNPDREIYQKLKHARAQKIIEAPNSLRNALFAEREAANLLSVHTALPTAAQLPIPTEISQALEFFVAFAQSFEQQLAGDYASNPSPIPFSRSQFEKHMASLSRRKYAGEILLAMSTVTHYLSSVEQAVSQSMSANRVCRRDSRSGQVQLNPTTKQALEHVFHTHYLGRLQPQLHQIQRGARAMHQWQPLIENLAPDASDPLRRYWQRTWSDQEASLWSEFQIAIKQHAAMWQRILSECGIMELPPIE